MMILFGLLCLASAAIFYHWKNKRITSASSHCCPLHPQGCPKKPHVEWSENTPKEVHDRPQGGGLQPKRSSVPLECKFMRDRPDLTSESWVAFPTGRSKNDRKDKGKETGEREEAEEGSEEEEEDGVEEIWLDHRAGPGGVEVLTLRRRRRRPESEVLITASMQSTDARRHLNR